VPESRFLFILGTGRCGSTLLARLLARHPDFAFVPEKDEATGGSAREPSEAYALLAREVSPILVAPFRDLLATDVTPWLRGRLRAFFDRRAELAGHPVFMHKFTGWPRAGFLLEALPESWFVHIFRDGRAVANSLIQAPWWQGWAGHPGWAFGPLPQPYADEWERADRSFVLLAGLEWKLLLDSLEAARALVPAERWLDVRYEDLVATPRPVLGRILRHVELEDSAAVDTAIDSIAVVRDRLDAFTRELGAKDVELLTASLATHLHRWGYVP
jgi:Sulfotransferase family